jgi:uncharacterized protein
MAASTCDAAVLARAKRAGGGLALSLLVLVLLPRAAAAAGELPAFTNYVVDEAGLVPDEVERQVDVSLGAYEQRSGNQLAVAVVRSTGGRAIEEYSLALANSWAVGQRGKNNGVLVVIAIEDRRVRIEVGGGLQAVLTNDKAAGIVNDGMVQRLRSGDVGGAVVFATETIRRSLGDTPVAAPPTAAASVPTPAPIGAPAVPPVQGYPGPQTSPYSPQYDGGRGMPGHDDGFPGWIFLAIPVIGLIGIVASLGRSQRSGYHGGGPMFWGQGAGWAGSRHRDSWFGSSGSSFGSSFGSGSGGGGGDGGGFSGGGGGSFDGGGASGSW